MLISAGTYCYCDLGQNDLYLLRFVKMKRGGKVLIPWLSPLSDFTLPAGT